MSPTHTVDEELAEQVRDTLASTLKVPAEAIAPHAGQADVEGWDSLGQLNLVMELEGRFKISFTTEQVLRMRSIPEIVAVIKEHLHGR